MSTEREPNLFGRDSNLRSDNSTSRRLALDHQEAVVCANLNLYSAREKAQKNEDPTIYPGLEHLVESGFADKDSDISVLREAYSLTIIEALNRAEDARVVYHYSIGTIPYNPVYKRKGNY